MITRTGITFHQLQTFLAVARTGNLTKVARELNATQPTVSLQLRSLRKAFGIQLFERPGGRFRLTPAGEKLQRYAEETLDGLRSLHQDIGVLKGSLTGSLAVGVTFFVIGRIMQRLVPTFRARFPGVDLQVHIDRPDPLFDQLLTNTLDVVCYLKVASPPGLTFEPLGYDEELAIIASPRHRLARRRRISASDLSEEPLVVSSVSVFRELIEAKLRAVGIIPRVVAEAQNYDAIKQLVERNVGYSVHVKSLVDAELATGRLVTLKLNKPIYGELGVAFRSRPGMSPLIHEFVRFLRAELARSRETTQPKAEAQTSQVGRARRARGTKSGLR